jgi:signal transduction histidine kinase
MSFQPGGQRRGGVPQGYDLKIIGFILTIIAAYSLSLPAFTQSSDDPAPDALLLTDEQGEYPLGYYLDILEDPSGELTIEDVSSPEYDSRFVRSQVAVPNYGITDSAYWLRLSLLNETSLTTRWFLETVFQNLNYVDVYIPSGGGGFVKKESGGLRPFDTRDIPYYHVVFELPLAGMEEQTIYIRVESGSSMTLSFTLWSPEAFAIIKINDMLRNGLFYGSLLMVLAYHLFLLFSLKEANYIYFVLSLATAILFFATYEGIADQYLWPGLSQEKKYLLSITMALFVIAALKFSDVFLEQKIRSPRFHKLYYIFYGYWGLVLLIVPYVNYAFLSRIVDLGLLLTSLIIILAGFYSWKKGYPPARYFLISWLGFMVGLFIVVLVRIGLIPSIPITEKAYQLGLVWMALLSSLALADRIKMLKVQTEITNLALRNSENRLSQILEGLPLGVVVYGKDQKPSYINRRTVEILGNPARGIQPDPSAGRTLSQAMDYFSFRISGSDLPYPLENMPVERALQGEAASVDDIEADLVDKCVPLEIWANPIKDDLGNVEAAVVAFQDITRRAKAEAELNEYRHHLEMLVEQRTAELNVINDQLSEEIAERKLLEDTLYKRVEWLSAVNRIHQSISNTADLPNAFRQLSATIMQLLGAENVFIGLWDGHSDYIDALCCPRADVSPQVFERSAFILENDSSLRMDIEGNRSIIIPADQFGDLPDPIGACLHTDDLQSFILKPMKSRQALIGLLGLGIQQPTQAITGELPGLIDRIALDLADLVEDAHLFEKAQALAATEERNRLARDLHDSVTQVLFSASLVAEVLPQIWQRNPKMAQQSLVDLRRLTRGALAEMRTMLLELRPSAVIKTPLGELLAQLTEAITARSGVPYQLFIEQVPTLPEEVHTSFYRIAQEGLNNIVKHAQAKLVRLRLSAAQDPSTIGEEWRGEVKLVIEDDGVGFTIQDITTEHMGMSIIRERAAAINATISVNSQPGHGTVLILTWHNMDGNSYV